VFQDLLPSPVISCSAAYFKAPLEVGIVKEDIPGILSFFQAIEEVVESF